MANTTTTISSSANPCVFGQSVIITATVNAVAPGSGTRTGTVTFTLDGVDQAPAGLNASGQATITNSTFSLGSHTISAAYSGDGNFNSNTSTNFIQTVSKADTTTTVGSSANPSILGQSVTFTATVTATAPGSGTPTGTVIFKDGATTLSTNTLGSGQATFTSATLSVGSHSITAVYNGDANYNISTNSPALTQTVNKGSTTTTVASSQNPSVFSQSVTFTATVTGTNGTPTGTVTFKDGATALATNALSGGQATLTTSLLAGGLHSITAVYNGDTTFTNSTSAALTQTVNKGSSATTITSSQNPSVFGQSVITATVTGTNGTPTGTVTFKDGATALGTNTLTSGKPPLRVRRYPPAPIRSRRFTTVTAISTRARLPH